MGIGSVVGGVARGALGSLLGQEARDDLSITRVEPPERKFANFALMSEARRGLTGRKSFADLLEEHRLRSEIEKQQGVDAQAILQRYGQMGVESPGIMNRLEAGRTSGLQRLIGSLNDARMKRKFDTMRILELLLAQNQPYNIGELKEGSSTAKALSGALEGGAQALGDMKPKKKPTETTSPGVDANDFAQNMASKFSLTGNKLKTLGLNSLMSLGDA